MDSILQLAGEIAKAQAGVRPMSEEDMRSFLIRTAQILDEITKTKDIQQLSPYQTFQHTPSISPNESILQDKIICLECGEEMQVLDRRHLEKHNLTPEQYIKKYNFPFNQPLMSGDELERRRQTATPKFVMQPDEAIQEESIFCCLCGKEMKQLTKKHFKHEHNMTTDEYRALCGYPKGHPLMCKRLVRQRQQNMKEKKIWQKNPTNGNSKMKIRKKEPEVTA